MAYLKVALLATLLTGCFATSSDLRDLADQIKRDVPDRGDVISAIEDKADEIEQRAETMVDAATGITSPSGLVDIGIAALLAFAGTNVYRNGTRRKALAKVQNAA